MSYLYQILLYFFCAVLCFSHYLSFLLHFFILFIIITLNFISSITRWFMNCLQCLPLSKNQLILYTVVCIRSSVDVYRKTLPYIVHNFTEKTRKAKNTTPDRYTFLRQRRNLGPGVTWRPIYYPADVLFSRALTRFVSLINGFKKSLLSHILRTVDQEYWNVLAYFTKRSPALYSGNYDGKEKVWISFFSLYIIWNFKGFAKEYRLLLSMHLTAQTETNC